jgi:hypothetical protein
MSGPTAPRAAFPGAHFEMVPPLTRSAVESIVGPLPDDAWNAIRRAFRDLGAGLEALKASKDNRKKDDPDGWHALRSATVRDLEAALAALERSFDDPRRRFLSEASENYAFTHDGERPEAIDLLMEAQAATLGALVIVERALPERREVSSESELRRRATRELAAILAKIGITSAATDGWNLDQLLEGAAESDLTTFEQLVSALGLHVAETPAALSVWVRRALAEHN